MQFVQVTYDNRGKKFTSPCMGFTWTYLGLKKYRRSPEFATSLWTRLFSGRPANGLGPPVPCEGIDMCTVQNGRVSYWRYCTPLFWSLESGHAAPLRVQWVACYVALEAARPGPRPAVSGVGPPRPLLSRFARTANNETVKDVSRTVSPDIRSVSGCRERDDEV
jgi:hypothetical protein